MGLQKVKGMKSKTFLTKDEQGCGHVVPHFGGDMFMHCGSVTQTFGLPFGPAFTFRLAGRDFFPPCGTV